MAFYQTKTATIPLSGTVSGDIQITNGALVGVLAPVLTSCSLFIQTNADTTSAGFVRVGKTDGTGAWGWQVGAGSAAIAVADIAGPFGYYRLETSAVQAAARTFQLVVKIQ